MVESYRERTNRELPLVELGHCVAQPRGIVLLRKVGPVVAAAALFSFESRRGGDSCSLDNEGKFYGSHPLQVEPQETRHLKACDFSLDGIDFPDGLRKGFFFWFHEPAELHLLVPQFLVVD